MKSLFRVSAAAWAVGVAILLVSYKPAAQAPEGELEPDLEPVVVTREYDVRSLLRSELWTAPRTGAVFDVLSPDRLFSADGEHQLDEWSLRDSGEEARCWDSADDLGADVSSLLNEAGNEVYSNGGDDALSLEGSVAGHGLTAWILDALEDVAAARVSMVVYRLPEGTRPDSPSVAVSDVAGWAKGARFVGNFRGGLGEPFVVQRTQQVSYVADYELNIATEAVVAEPLVNNLHTGEEFVVAAISLPDGRVWVQGWHAAMNHTRMRTIESNSGVIELPEVSYLFTPVSAVIENGGAAVIDAGPAGRFMVRAESDRVVKNHKLTLDNGRTIRLISCVGSMHGYGMGGHWLMDLTSGELFEASIFPRVMFGVGCFPQEDIAEGPYRHSAYGILETLNLNHARAICLGPYLGVVTPASADRSEEELAEIDAETALFDAIPVAPATARVRISAYEVADSVALPAGILTGRPSTADVAELKSLAGDKVALDRISTGALRTQVDLYEVKLATHLRDYHSTAATGITALDPAVGTMVLGKQVRWQAREAQDGKLRIEVRTGITVGGAEFEKVAIGNEGLMVERSRSALTQGRLADELAAGERMAAISPGAGVDGQLVVIVVERLK